MFLITSLGVQMSGQASPGFAYKRGRFPLARVLITLNPQPVIFYTPTLSQHNDLLHFIRLHTPPRAHRSCRARLWRRCIFPEDVRHHV